MAFEAEFTAAEVRAMSAKLGVGMYSAKLVLQKQAASRRIQLIRESGQYDLADVLEFLLEGRQ